MQPWMKSLFAPYSAETKKVQMIFFFGSWALLAAIGLFIPETVLTDNPNLRAFTDFMASFIPQIDRVTALDLRPEVNRLHYSILWAVSPVFPGLMLPAILRTTPTGGKLPTYGKALGALLFSVLLVGESMFLLMTSFLHDPNVYDRVEHVAFYYPLSRAILAPIMVTNFWIFSTVIAVVVWGFITGRFHRATDGATNEGKAHG